MDRSLIKLEEGPLITGYLGVELARVNTRGDIYPNARKLCVRSSSSIPFRPLVRPSRVFYDDQCKELRDKKREKKRSRRRRGWGSTLSPNIGCPFIKRRRFRSALISFPPAPFFADSASIARVRRLVHNAPLFIALLISWLGRVDKRPVHIANTIHRRLLNHTLTNGEHIGPLTPVLS